MSIGVRLFVAIVLVLASATVPVNAQRQTHDSVEALRRWVDAVNDHTPGETDAAAKLVAGMSYSARVHLNTSNTLFIRVLRGDSVVTRSPLDEAVTRLARTVKSTPGASTFLKRAAVLHADVVVFAQQLPMPPNDAPTPPPRRERLEPSSDLRRLYRGEAVPPLLLNELITLTKDGEVIGNGRADWNLPFARSLLDMLLNLTEDSQAAAAFVAAWYHAVSAFLFFNGQYGDATAHLAHAARVLPGDPHVHFDAGTYAEALGLPIYQVVLDDPAYALPAGFRSGIPTGSMINGEAERSYRRALALDPGYVEARVRLARLLDVRGQHQEASEEITKALAANPKDVLGYYAHLVAGRIASAGGRFEDALRHYRTASGMHPFAQSALLGASHAALMLANAREALVPVEEIGGRDERSTADPWWDYELGAGRDVNELLAGLWSRVTK